MISSSFWEFDFDFDFDGEALVLAFFLFLEGEGEGEAMAAASGSGALTSFTQGGSSASPKPTGSSCDERVVSRGAKDELRSERRVEERSDELE